MIKIKEYSVMKSGNATKVIALPKVWMTDNNVKQYDHLDVFRHKLDGKDVLVIAKQGK